MLPGPDDAGARETGLRLVAIGVLVGVLVVAVLLAAVPAALGTSWEYLGMRAWCEWCHLRP